MAYTPQTWTDGVSAASAARLTHMEDGIEDADDRLVVVEGDITTIESALTALGTGTYAAYTPVWTATGTAPALNNGTISGRWTKLGKLVHVWGTLTMGNTTTFGTGSYRISLPVNAAAYANLSPIGEIAARDSSTGNMIQCDATVSGSTQFRGLYLAAMPIGAPTEIAQTTPWTWADADAIYWHLFYEAA